jgi:hypothetical protein
MRISPRILSGLTAAFAASALAVPAAQADIVVRPVKTWNQDPTWLVTPSLSTPAAVLDDDVLQPQAPDTTDYLSGTAKGTFDTAVGIASPALADGQSVTGATAWVYAGTGPNQWLTVSLWSGFNVLAWRAFPPGQAAAWRSVPVTQAVTSDQAKSLALLLRTDNSANTGWGRVSAAYVDLTTIGDPAPQESTPPPADEPPAGTGPAPPPEVDILERVVKVTIHRGHPVAPLTLSCPTSAATRCRVQLTIRLLPSGSTRRLAVGARCGRGCRPIGNGSYTVAQGHRRKVRVRMSLRTGQVFGHRRRAKTRITVDSRDASGRRAVSNDVVTLTR